MLPCFGTHHNITRRSIADTSSARPHGAEGHFDAERVEVLLLHARGARAGVPFTLSTLPHTVWYASPPAAVRDTHVSFARPEGPVRGPAAPGEHHNLQCPPSFFTPLASYSMLQSRIELPPLGPDVVGP
jgi:hypothetical protein